MYHAIPSPYSGYSSFMPATSMMAPGMVYAPVYYQHQPVFGYHPQASLGGWPVSASPGHYTAEPGVVNPMTMTVPHYQIPSSNIDYYYQQLRGRDNVAVAQAVLGSAKTVEKEKECPVEARAILPTASTPSTPTVSAASVSHPHSKTHSRSQSQQSVPQPVTSVKVSSLEASVVNNEECGSISVVSSASSDITSIHTLSLSPPPSSHTDSEDTELIAEFAARRRLRMKRRQCELFGDDGDDGESTGHSEEDRASVSGSVSSDDTRPTKLRKFMLSPVRYPISMASRRSDQLETAQLLESIKSRLVSSELLMSPNKPKSLPASIGRPALGSVGVVSRPSAEDLDDDRSSTAAL